MLQVFIAAQTVASADVPLHHLWPSSRIQGTPYNLDIRIAGLARQGSASLRALAVFQAD